MFKTTKFLLYASVVLFATSRVHAAWPDITTPKDDTPLAKKMTDLMPAANQGHDKYGYFITDGHAWSIPLYQNGKKTDKWIIHTTYDWSYLSTSPKMADIYANWSANISDYDPSQIYQIPPGGNFVTLKPGLSFAGPTPKPPANVTGFRVTNDCAPHDDCSDSTTYWLMNAFHVSETSGINSTINPDFLIGFAHNEDHWYPPSKNGAYREVKHVGVRYSNDSGKSWTRSVPILTRGRQDEGGTGCGDMAVMWNHKLNIWQAFMQEYVGEPGPNGLIMAYSNDTYARPGTWHRIQPNSSTPDRWAQNIDYALDYGTETILKNTTLSKDNGRRCTNPSIIWDERAQYWHMVCQIWGGGLRYSNSTDGLHWKVPEDLKFAKNQTWYPTLIGNNGDRNTTDGTATLYYWNTTGSQNSDVNRHLYTVEWQFPNPNAKTTVSGTGSSVGGQNVLGSGEL